MKQHQQPWVVEVCRGASGRCPNALPLPPELVPALERTLAAQGPAAPGAGEPAPKPHHTLRIHVAACPNGCSRPQIADLGLMAALPPLPPDSCSCCGACVAVCPDAAVHLDAGASAPRIDRLACLRCGLCVRACPEDAMQAGVTGLRVHLGGKLGRRPLLALELPDLRDTAGVCAVLERALAALRTEGRPGLRLAELRQARLRQGASDPALEWGEDLGGRS